MTLQLTLPLVVACWQREEEEHALAVAGIDGEIWDGRDYAAMMIVALAVPAMIVAVEGSRFLSVLRLPHRLLLGGAYCSIVCAGPWPVVDGGAWMTPLLLCISGYLNQPFYTDGWLASGGAI